MHFSQQDSQKLSRNILFQSVLYFSGANSFAGIYEKLIPATGFSYGPNGVQPHQAWDSLLGALKNSSLEANNLRDAVITRNNITVENLSETQAIDAGIRDASWSTTGKEKKQQREQRLFAAANIIADAWTKKKLSTTGNGRMSNLLISSLFKTQSLSPTLPREIKEEHSKHSAILKLTP